MNRREILGCFVGMAAFPAMIGRMFRRRPRVENRSLTLCHEVIGWDFVNCRITGDSSGNAALRNCTLIDSEIFYSSDNPVAVTGCRMFFTGRRKVRAGYSRAVA